MKRKKSLGEIAIAIEEAAGKISLGGVVVIGGGLLLRKPAIVKAGVGILCGSVVTEKAANAVFSREVTKEFLDDEEVEDEMIDPDIEKELDEENVQSESTSVQETTEKTAE